MTKTTNAALFFLAAGLFTSVTVLGAYQILIAIPMVYYTYLAIKEKKYALPRSAWWLLGFSVVALISLVVNFDLVPRPTKNFGRIKYFILGVAGIFVYRAWLQEATDKTKKFILNTFFVSIIVAGLYAIYTFAFTETLRANVLTEKMRYGYGSGMILLVVLGVILHREKLQKILTTPLAITAFSIGFIGMYLTYTRGALLGFLCGFPFLIYFYKKKLGLILGGAAVGVVLVLAGFYLFGTGDYQSRLLVSKNNSSDNIRRSQWEAAIIATKEKPVLGWGLSNFHTQLKRIKIENDLAAKSYDDAHSHNLFLEVASGTGLVGLFFFLGWLISWAIECFKEKEIVRGLIVPFGVAFVVSSQFEVTFDANNASMIFFIYGLSSAFRTNQDNFPVGFKS